MAKVKYYHTLAIFYADPAFKKKYGFESHQNQYSIGCTTTSYKKANTIAESLGLGRGVFRPDYTYVHDSPELIGKCEKLGGFIIKAGKEYVSIQEAMKTR